MAATTAPPEPPAAAGYLDLSTGRARDTAAVAREVGAVLSGKRGGKGGAPGAGADAGAVIKVAHGGFVVYQGGEDAASTSTPTPTPAARVTAYLTANENAVPKELAFTGLGEAQGGILPCLDFAEALFAAVVPVAAAASPAAAAKTAPGALHGGGGLRRVSVPRDDGGAESPSPRASPGLVKNNAAPTATAADGTERGPGSGPTLPTAGLATAFDVLRQLPQPLAATFSVRAALAKRGSAGAPEPGDRSHADGGGGGGGDALLSPSASSAPPDNANTVDVTLDIPLAVPQPFHDVGGLVDTLCSGVDGERLRAVIGPGPAAAGEGKKQADAGEGGDNETAEAEGGSPAPRAPDGDLRAALTTLLTAVNNLCVKHPDEGAARGALETTARALGLPPTLVDDIMPPRKKESSSGLGGPGGARGGLASRFSGGAFGGGSARPTPKPAAKTGGSNAADNAPPKPAWACAKYDALCATLHRRAMDAVVSLLNARLQRGAGQPRDASATASPSPKDAGGGDSERPGAGRLSPRPVGGRASAFGADALRSESPSPTGASGLARRKTVGASVFESQVAGRGGAAKGSGGKAIPGQKDPHTTTIVLLPGVSKAATPVGGEAGDEALARTTHPSPPRDAEKDDSSTTPAPTPPAPQPIPTALPQYAARLLLDLASRRVRGAWGGGVAQHGRERFAEEDGKAAGGGSGVQEFEATEEGRRGAVIAAAVGALGEVFGAGAADTKPTATTAAAGSPRSASPGGGGGASPRGASPFGARAGGGGLGGANRAAASGAGAGGDPRDSTPPPDTQALYRAFQKAGGAGVLTSKPPGFGDGGGSDGDGGGAEEPPARSGGASPAGSPRATPALYNSRSASDRVPAAEAAPAARPLPYPMYLRLDDDYYILPEGLAELLGGVPCPELAAALAPGASKKDKNGSRDAPAGSRGVGAGAGAGLRAGLGFPRSKSPPPPATSRGTADGEAAEKEPKVDPSVARLCGALLAGHSDANAGTPVHRLTRLVHAAGNPHTVFVATLSTLPPSASVEAEPGRAQTAPPSPHYNLAAYITREFAGIGRAGRGGFSEVRTFASMLKDFRLLTWGLDECKAAAARAEKEESSPPPSPRPLNKTASSASQASAVSSRVGGGGGGGIFKSRSGDDRDGERDRSPARKESPFGPRAGRRQPLQQPGSPTSPQVAAGKLYKSRGADDFERASPTERAASPFGARQQHVVPGAASRRFPPAGPPDSEKDKEKDIPASARLAAPSPFGARRVSLSPPPGGDRSSGGRSQPQPQPAAARDLSPQPSGDGLGPGTAGDGDGDAKTDEGSPAAKKPDDSMTMPPRPPPMTQGGLRKVLAALPGLGGDAGEKGAPAGSPVGVGVVVGKTDAVYLQGAAQDAITEGVRKSKETLAVLLQAEMRARVARVARLARVVLPVQRAMRCFLARRQAPRQGVITLHHQGAKPIRDDEARERSAIYAAFQAPMPHLWRNAAIHCQKNELRERMAIMDAEMNEATRLFWDTKNKVSALQQKIVNGRLEELQTFNAAVAFLNEKERAGRRGIAAEEGEAQKALGAYHLDATRAERHRLKKEIKKLQKQQREVEMASILRAQAVPYTSHSAAAAFAPSRSTLRDPDPYEATHTRLRATAADMYPGGSSPVPHPDNWTTPERQRLRQQQQQQQQHYQHSPPPQQRTPRGGSMGGYYSGY